MKRLAVILGFAACLNVWAQDRVLAEHGQMGTFIIRMRVKPPEEIGEFSKYTFDQMVDLDKRVREFEASRPAREPVSNKMKGSVRGEPSDAPRYALSDLKTTLDAAIKDYRAKGEFDVAWKVTGIFPPKVEKEKISEEERRHRVSLILGLIDFGDTILMEQIKHHEILHRPRKVSFERGNVEGEKGAVELIPLAPPSAKAYEAAMPEDLKKVLLLLQVRHNLLPKPEIF